MGVDGHRLQAVLVGGADDAARDLATVADHDPGRGALVAVGRSGCVRHRFSNDSCRQAGRQWDTGAAEQSVITATQALPRSCLPPLPPPALLLL